MSSSVSGADGVPPVWLSSLESLQTALDDQDWENALRECLTLLLRHGKDLPDVIRSKVTILQSQVYCRLEKYTQIKSPSPLEAYALYRQKKYPESLEKATTITADDDGDDSKADDFAMLNRHVAAQAYYRVGKYDEALKEYQAILQHESYSNGDDEDDDDGDEERCELLTNALAVAVAGIVPSSISDDVHPESSTYSKDLDWLLEAAESALSSFGNEYSVMMYELAYNFGTYHSLTGNKTLGRQWLQKALKAAQEQTENDANEMGPIQVNLAVLVGDEEELEIETSLLSPAPQAIYKFNQKSSLAKAYAGSSPPSTDVMTTEYQRLAWHYNKAVLMLQQSTSASNSKAATKYFNEFKMHLDKIRKQTSSLWWKAQCAVVEAHLLSKQKGPAAGLALLESSRKEILSSKNSYGQDEKDEAMTILILNSASLQQRQIQQDKNDSDTADVQVAKLQLAALQQLPQSVQQRAGVVAMKNRLQDKIRGEAVTEADNKSDPLLIARDFAMAEEFEKVVETLEPRVTSSKDEVNTEMKLVYWQALAKTDSAKALEAWESLGLADDVPELVDVEEMDGEELEKRPLPRIKGKKKKKKRAQDEVTTTQSSTLSSALGSKKKRSKESVLRRRAKLREAHIAKLEAQGKNTSKPPDPERWIPKYERSSNRRGRRGGQQQQHVGSQGGVAERDMAKLDVAARKKAGGAIPGAGPSTANMAVASGGTKRKGGKKR